MTVHQPTGVAPIRDQMRLDGNGDAASLQSWLSESGHFVHFYESDASLLGALFQYIRLGIEQEDACIIIATAAHRKGLEERLLAAGIDVEAAREGGRYIPLDAQRTLDRFMVDGDPDPDRFAEVIGAVLSAAARGSSGVRAFGEMVALLWNQENRDAAIRLEELWNDLAEAHAFALLCAYPLDAFGTDADSNGFACICQRHTQVIPAESYASLANEESRGRQIALLQQKARALEAEVEARGEAERLLRQREEELSDFLDNAVEGLHRVGPDGTILWANRAELSLLGYEPEEYIGRHIAEFHADQDVIEDILARLLRGETLYNYPARLLARDGSIRHVLIHSNTRWADGEVCYTRCFTRDVTDRKRAEDDRDAVLARERAARAELERANEDLRDFAYIVSHDLKEPLRGISNYSAFVLKDHGEALGTEGRPKVETIQRLARRSYDLLDAVLAFSRIGRERIRIEEIKADHLFGCAFDNVRGRIDDEEALVTFEPSELRLHCDTSLALQVLTNLITNGLKYNESKPKRIEVGCALGKSGEVEISVKDNGIGIDARHRANIFRMFKRLHARDRYGGGTGAGLAIARRIIERHGGRIWLESEPGEGSTFYFTLAAPGSTDEAGEAALAIERPE